MSEDRLERALEAMKNESVSPEQLAGAKARVLERLVNPGLVACGEFQPEFAEYLSGRLAGKRRLLMEDHLSRCPHCRTRLADLKGKRNVVEMPRRSSFRWSQWGGLAAAAALVLMVLYLGRDRIDTLLAPGGPRATISSVSGGLYRIPAGVLKTGMSLDENEMIRTAPGAHAVLRLADGSAVEVNERTELSLQAAWSGTTIHLQRGDIIVQAAKQRRGHLRVRTRDSVASVKGTVFAVSTGLSGSLVSVVEGSVEVDRPGAEVTLGPGQQTASNPSLMHSVGQAVAWSPEAENYLQLLASLATLDKQMAGLPSPALRTQSRLLQYMPANTIIYGAVPNLGGTISQTTALIEQQAAENPSFQAWWTSSSGRELKFLLDQVQTVTPLLGDEIVFEISTGDAGVKEQIPVVVAEVQPGRGAELENALESLRSQTGPIPYTLSDTIVAVSDSQTHLQWMMDHFGQGATSPFAQAVSGRYQRGVGWLFAMDIEPASALAAANPASAILGLQQMKDLFLEQRVLQGVEQNEVTLTFNGPRTGLASWLAGTGSGGAAEYLPTDTILAIYASTREPAQLFNELTAQISKLTPSAEAEFSRAEEKLGPGFAADLAAALGTESAFALEGLSMSGPVWVLAALVNNPPVLDGSIRKLVDVVNSELAPGDQSRQITLEQETSDGRTWTVIKSGAGPLSITWTYDGGYLVAGSDRGAVARAIATRNGGSPLVYAPEFQQQMPSSASMHPSGFAWLNTRGALQGLASLTSNPIIKQLIAERDPILAVFDGTAEQIHASSRTRISGLIVDLMLLKSLGRAGSGGQAATFLRGGAQTGTR